MERNVNLNVITLGDIAVGKTSIIKRIKDGSFDENYKATIGSNFFFIKRKYQLKNIIITLNFQDTGGQEQFQSIIPLQYIRNCHIVLLVFADLKSFESLKNRWYKFYKKNCNIKNSRFILVGNKCDIFEEEREEIIKKGDEFAQEIDSLFMTCSAKNKDNMDNLDRYITQEARRFIDDEEKKPKNKSIKYKLNDDDSSLTNDNSGSHNKKKCC